MLPLTFRVPVTLKLLFEYNKFIEAVAEFVLLSARITLPIAGL
jgi:hypothetical protein